ncbi:hypothetical protein LZF95_26935 [Algoriphagus sp. AGSA1]|nr:hypothetical protein [Algoriphagus sp. AGSA1]
MKRIKVHVLVAQSDGQARADPLWQWFENDDAHSAILLSCSESLVDVSLARALVLDPFLADRYEYGEAGQTPSACVGVMGAALAKAQALERQGPGAPSDL